MSDYIKREDAAKILLQRREFAENQEWTQEVDLMELLCERLEEVPAAVVRPVVREHLISPNPYGTCSNCNWLIDSRDGFSYCPNCGAMMEES